MDFYAYIEDGIVIEIIAPMADAQGDEIPIEDRYHPDFVKNLIKITGVDPRPDQNWTYDGMQFYPPSSAG